jgi:hypothetical protein
VASLLNLETGLTEKLVRCLRAVQCLREHGNRRSYPIKMRKDDLHVGWSLVIN